MKSYSTALFFHPHSFSFNSALSFSVIKSHSGKPQYHIYHMLGTVNEFSAGK